MILRPFVLFIDKIIIKKKTICVYRLRYFAGVTKKCFVNFQRAFVSDSFSKAGFYFSFFYIFDKNDKRSVVDGWCFLEVD